MKNIKRIFASLMVAVMVLTAAPLSGFVGMKLNLDWLDFTQKASAASYSGTCGNNLIWSFDKTTGELKIEGTGAMDDFVPSSMPWKEHKNSITGAIISEGVTSIGSGAFYYCTHLTSIIIPESVTCIGASAFFGCENLVSVVIPEGVTSIDDSAFSLCYALTYVDIPKTVKTIDGYAFESTSIISLNIPDGVISIGEAAFYGSMELERITIPDSVTSLENSTFADCPKLQSINVSTGNTAYSSDNYGVLFDKDKTEIINYPEGRSETSYTIPESVTKIGKYAFYGCDKLISLNIPASVTDIDYYAFGYNDALTDIYYDGTESDWKKIDMKNGESDFQSITIHFSEPEDPYSSICGENVTWSIDAETKTLTISGQGAMYDFNESIVVPWQHSYGDFDKIVIEDGVTHIGASSFAYFDNVTDISIPDSVITIGIDAFYNTGYYNDKNNWENGVLYIGNYLIEFNSDISDVCIIPEGILTVADYADKNEEKTVKFILPDSLISIGECAFMGPEVTIPVLGTSIKYFSDNAFYDVTFIKVEISPDIEELSENVFEECSIECLTFRNTLKIVGNGTFMQCACEDVYYLGTEEEWNQIVFGTGNEMLIYLYTHNTGSVHFLGSEHNHSYSSEITTPPTGEFDGTETFTCICGDYYEESVPALGFDVFDGVAIDFATNTISGFNAGDTSLDSYTTTVNDNYVWEYETSNGKLGTGSKAILKDGDTVIGEYTILVYGDATCDSWYDGQDAIIVDCLANGMLTKDDVGEAVYMAADCNHDGVIDQLDVALLNQAGTLLANVDQSKPAEVLLETSSEYVEYLDLIDQSPEIDAEDDTDIPEVDVETEDTTPEQDAKVDIFKMIMNFIKSIFEMLLSYIPMPLK